MQKNKLKPKIVITCHNNADFDALAAMVAAKKLYPNSVLIFPGSQEKSLRNFFIESASYLYNFKTINDIIPESVETLVVVDTRQTSRLDHVKKILKNKELEIHIFDHHPSSEEDLEADFIEYKPWGSTTTIIVLKLKEKNISITPDEATLFGLGIYEDTGSFTFNSTTPYDFIAASWLREQKMDVNTIAEFIHKELSAEQIFILNNLIQNASKHHINGIDIVITEVSLEEYVGDFALLVHKFMEMENIKVLFALGRMNDRVHLVARSKLKEVDVGKICNYFGGGGHTFAASASIKNKTLNQIKEELFAILYSKINQQISIKTLMSTPPIFLESNKTLEEAAKLMTRLGLKAIPIVQPNTKHCVGILEHQLAHKAVIHNLGNLVIQDYMQRNIQVVSPNSSLHKIVEIILEHKQRLVPVVDEKKELLGVFTRTDLINFLVQESIPISEDLFKNGKKKEKNIKFLLKEKLSTEFFNIITTAGKIAEEMGYQVYMVGGIVRDILLNFPTLDLDLVVEGDGIAFAQKLAQIFKGRIKSHKKFKTAVIILSSGQKIDVATARLEYYEYPAALPTVELSSLKMDLYRRDFSINTLAVHLNPSRFGKLIDFFGGQRDLKQKKIRVLHALSFIEDPTRILRAVRFEQRFNFHIGKQTFRLIKNALKLDILNKVSGNRIYQELILIFKEKKSIQCLFKLQEYNILKSIHPLLNLTENLQNLFLEINNILNWYNLLYLNEKVKIELLYFLVLLSNLKYEDTKKVISRLNFSKKQKDIFFELREKTKFCLIEFDRYPKKYITKISKLYLLLDDIPIEGILFIIAKIKNEELRQKIAIYVAKFRRIKLAISGKDLIALGLKPGPIFGEILKEVKQISLDNQIYDKQSQLELAKKLIDRKKITF
ncbi:tRNA nucleotidyltransferase (CCA-adding enzyme) [Desulfonauticus submarinus]|uniref:tRNA nucleotidyltransferase (CCA-adding enzyme) n=1 Tax=Desulfonauticus submarinus TaxID=206665 RepID=A0A1H0A1J7_9BACT|nr:CBS domain-containing protein [Desulfonauticus submarinus]SDN27355.1 tRNA nucleotidyltransferase (CCA-adding enzyme) [Desulfonauticus submarinus]